MPKREKKKSGRSLGRRLLSIFSKPHDPCPEGGCYVQEFMGCESRHVDVEKEAAVVVDEPDVAVDTLDESDSSTVRDATPDPDMDVGTLYASSQDLADRPAEWTSAVLDASSAEAASEAASAVEPTRSASRTELLVSRNLREGFGAHRRPSRLPPNENMYSVSACDEPPELTSAYDDPNTLGDAPYDDPNATSAYDDPNTLGNSANATSAYDDPNTLGSSANATSAYDDPSSLKMSGAPTTSTGYDVPKELLDAADGAAAGYDTPNALLAAGGTSYDTPDGRGYDDGARGYESGNALLDAPLPPASPKSALSWSSADHSGLLDVLNRSNPELVRAELVKIFTASDDDLLQSGQLSLHTLAGALTQHDALNKEVDLHWNAAYISSTSAFQAAQSPEDVVFALQSMERLARDFQHSAKTYASIIVSELQTPNNRKTIPPVDIGGVAGGEKYIKNGILFKFAMDTCIRTSPKRVWMYGGDTPDDEAAAKAAGYELANLLSFAVTYENAIKLPLLALVDHLGFRLLAVALLPIGKKTIVYGSNDGGKTVHADDEEIVTMMRRACDWMGLEEHVVRDKKIVGPGDVEIHRGYDGNIYALDFARLMPPEAPEVDSSGRLVRPREVFQKLLRSEFVRSYHGRTGKRLCSDAFTGWNYFDPNRRRHEHDIREATTYLRTVSVKECAAQLEKVRGTVQFAEWHAEMGAVMASEDDAARAVADAQFHLRRAQLKRWVHGCGVNHRYIGLVRKHITIPGLRVLLASNAVARSIKGRIRAAFRKVMRSSETGVILSEWPFKEEVVRELNVVLGGGKASDAYWTRDIKEELHVRFRGLMTNDEAAAAYDMRRAVDMRLVILMLTEMLGIDIHADSLRTLWTSERAAHLYSFDIAALKPTIKAGVEASMATAVVSRLLAKKIEDDQSAMRLLTRAQIGLDAVLGLTSSCSMTHSQYGTLMSEMAERCHDPELREVFYGDALEEFDRSLELRVLPVTLTSYASTLFSFANFRESEGDAKSAKSLRALGKKTLAHLKRIQDEDSSCSWDRNMAQVEKA